MVATCTRHHDGLGDAAVAGQTQASPNRFEIPLSTFQTYSHTPFSAGIEKGADRPAIFSESQIRNPISIELIDRDALGITTDDYLDLIWLKDIKVIPTLPTEHGRSHTAGHEYHLTLRRKEILGQNNLWKLVSIQLDEDHSERTPVSAAPCGARD